MSFEEFKLQSLDQQCAHIDVTKAPSYPLWEKARLAKAKRNDRECKTDTFVADWHRLKAHVSLNTIGNDIVGFFARGKLQEHAAAVIRELGINFHTSSGIFRSFVPDTKQLYDLLNQTVK